MKLIVTIDTEEDSWGDFEHQRYTLQNIERIPLLQDLLDQYGVTPTYLITYPVAIDGRASSILRSILDQGRCEIGTHCHPWNTPPFDEDRCGKNSMLCNLPPDLQYMKLKCLGETIQRQLGIKPVSFRAGRWGYSQSVASNLVRLGYKIDTSITPYTSWVENHGPNFSDISPDICRFSSENIFDRSTGGGLLEIPATIGYLQRNFSLCTRILKGANHRSLKHLRLTGVLNKLKLIQKVWLSPEMADANSMIQLARRMKANNYEIINLFFHSQSLMYGLSPFVRTKDDEKQFVLRIRTFLKFAWDSGIQCIKLSEVPSALQRRRTLTGALRKSTIRASLFSS